MGRVLYAGCLCLVLSACSTQASLKLIEMESAIPSIKRCPPAFTVVAEGADSSETSIVHSQCEEGAEHRIGLGPIGEIVFHLKKVGETVIVQRVSGVYRYLSPEDLWKVLHQPVVSKWQISGHETVLVVGP